MLIHRILHHFILCMYKMFICNFVCTNLYRQMCIYKICMYTYLYIHTCRYVLVYTNLYVQICIYKFVDKNLCIQICINKLVSTKLCNQICTYTLVCTNFFVQTKLPKCLMKKLSIIIKEKSF